MAKEHKSGLRKVVSEIRDEAARQMRGFPSQLRRQTTSGWGQEPVHRSHAEVGSPGSCSVPRSTGAAAGEAHERVVRRARRGGGVPQCLASRPRERTSAVG